MKRIGVFGGTFDPVHYGHIYLARQAVTECGLDHLFVTPAAAQPFKQEQTCAAGRHRFNMAVIAFEDDERISVSDIELKKDGVSYTIDTLKEMRAGYGKEAEIFFILGADAFLKIERWKDADELLKGFSFIVGTRPGYRQEELFELTERLNKIYNNNIMKINNKQTDVSSTEIKQAINSGGGLLRLLPPGVERYIDSNGLYRELH